MIVLIGRRTGSAAVVNAMDFRRELGALLVGEPTGGRVNTYGDSNTFELPLLKLRVSYATVFHRFEERELSAVMPDQFIEPRWEDFAGGRDAALTWALDYVRGPAQK